MHLRSGDHVGAMYATDAIKNVRNVNGYESATLDFRSLDGRVGVLPSDVYGTAHERILLCCRFRRHRFSDAMRFRLRWQGEERTSTRVDGKHASGGIQPS
jgi:hypothetical protein